MPEARRRAATLQRFGGQFAERETKISCEMTGILKTASKRNLHHRSSFVAPARRHMALTPLPVAYRWLMRIAASSRSAIDEGKERAELPASRKSCLQRAGTGAGANRINEQS